MNDYELSQAEVERIKQVFNTMKDFLPKHHSKHGLDDFVFRNMSLTVDYEDEQHYNINYLPQTTVMITPEIQLDYILFGYSRQCESHEFRLDPNFDYYVTKKVVCEIHGVVE